MPVFDLSSKYALFSFHSDLYIYDLVTGKNNVIGITGLSSGEEKKPPLSEAHDVVASCFASNECIVVGDSHKTLTILNNNTEGWKVTKQFILERKPSHILSSSDDKLIVLDRTGDVYSFSLQNENGSRGSLLMGHLSIILDLKISPCGKFIITCDRDEKIRVSHYPNAYNIERFLLGHTEFVSTIELVGDVIVSGSGDSTIRLWSLENGLLSTVETPQPVKQVLCISSSLVITSFYKSASLNIYSLIEKDGKALLSYKSSVSVATEILKAYVVKLENDKRPKCLAITHTSLHIFDVKEENGTLEISSDDTTLTVLKSIDSSKQFKECLSSLPSDEEVLKLLRKEPYDNVQDYLNRKEEREALLNAKRKRLSESSDSLPKGPSKKEGFEV